MTRFPRHPGAGTGPVTLGPDCEAAGRALWSYLDGELGASQRARIVRHLWRCKGCRKRVSFERRLLKEIRATRPLAADCSALRRRTVERLRQVRLQR
jgi:predicted anti-sigma-YlaC factor YlaD